MRIVVCVKQVYDPATVKISRSREDFDLRQAVQRMNPLDRYALEAALQLREAAGGEVIALSAGDASAEDTVREAVATGADHGVLLSGPEFAAAGGAGIAKAVAAALQRLGFVDLVFTGQADPVSGTGSLGARLAALLGWPVVLDVICLTAGSGGGLEAVAAAAGETIAVPVSTPAVLVAVPGRDRPRYPTAQRIANAYGPGLVDVWSAADLDLDPAALAPDTEPGGLLLGPERTRGQYIIPSGRSPTDPERSEGARDVSGDLANAATMVVEILKGKRIL